MKTEDVRMTLDDYFYFNHRLIMLESELNEIREIARQEIDLPDEEEINMTAEELLDVAGTEWTKDTPKIWIEGVKWALNKVRNPYPKTIQFQRDDEVGVMPSADKEIHPNYNQKMKEFWDKTNKETEGMTMIEYFNYLNKLLFP